MTSIEEYSTFFISIDKKQIKRYPNNYQNIKSTYFSKPVNKPINNFKQINIIKNEQQKMKIVINNPA